MAVCVLVREHRTNPDLLFVLLRATKAQLPPSLLLSLPSEIKLFCRSVSFLQELGQKALLIPLRQKESITYFSTLDFFFPKVVLVDQQPFQRDIVI